MACPWNFLWKLKSSRYDLTEEKDINNNVGKASHLYSPEIQDDPKYCSPGKHQNGSSQSLTGTAKKVPESQSKPHKPSPTCSQHMKIKNWGNGMILQDTLHTKAKTNFTCKPKSCLGSVMNPRSMTRGPRDTPIPPDELLPQAIEFVNQYYDSFKEAKIEEYLARVETVTKEIETTGTYQLTGDELIFATKLAWRNAPRCIGRIQWSNLQVFDARSCHTAQEMFEHICRHVRYSTNNGNIRSAITVFPQRTDGKHDFRVWNAQLIRYAGYQMPDGTIQGDPANLEFTQLCIDLGWKPRYGRFDVLPLILQADGRDPELFEIPPDLVLEVPMEHPKYEWFQDLGLKWYALPAVANMLLEVGGLEFPACPFNGWYMGTEIGVRDFCDAQRYNILEEVGRRMGLETHTLASLWKDRAVTEINVAVLHSFQKQNVTIMDHHSAAESFMKHMQNEYRARGGCPADWIWLVPPISGSITPVFHQEMLNYILSPFYYYQVEAWKTHVWQDETRRPKRREIPFRVLAKATLFASLLMRKMMASRVRATILFATETGKSEALAQDLGALFSCAFNPKVLCMDQYQLSSLEEEKLLLVVTSTFGNGDCPGNGETLKKSLFVLKKLTNTFRYAVFGLGSSMYPRFCAFAHDIDIKLSQLGASQLTPVGEGDELSGQEDAFCTWAVQTFQAACAAFDVRGRHHITIPKRYTSSVTWEPYHYRLVQDSQPLDLNKALSRMHATDVFTMRLKSQKNLQSPKSSRTTLLMELSCDDSRSLAYLPGEHLGVFPCNQPALVQGILECVVDNPGPHHTVCLEVLDDSGSYWAKDKRLPPCSLSQALTYFLDITTPPTQLQLQKLARLATEQAERLRLESLSQPSEYNKWKFTNSPTFLEVLEEFPSLRVPAAFLLSQLPILKPRYYSISSSLDHTPAEVHLTVAVVTYRTRDGRGPLHHGVCSTWFSGLKPQDPVPCLVRSVNSFQLPKDPSQPCILIGPGTGIAPFRSFWQQRLHNLKHTGLQGGRMTLLFGCRHPEEDHIYKEEMQEMVQKGVLHEVHTAYSRLPGKPKAYVQDILRQQLAREVLRVLHEEPGHLYVCGNVLMAQDVACTLKQLLAAKLNLNEEQVEDYFFQLKSQKRYHEDIFGAVFPHGVKKDRAERPPGDDKL
ncbi:nitric oxide synthase, inducible [Cavia porcellus]|uniref:Nitric oxide synthase, inducible n=1 Tax=Cavia porcellus TaxID=10141 RepID=NOS2_CAVPO|nr:nitric oxide synthase, inducible [Cavia porcellus]O54705.1 RecName: Full=Nitric oxide synthase, inducible; AltName: Full=Inducible NO synthase; Short=Inducible NOS; Short=iNOS; AltName: Full=NOS type II; AltName: Full=Peptidyl-cysteine S-nitrosylase NOS2 [Cavia porcellus]AAC33177.1 inducible nitric oxide synthase [Cavia porcellus]